MKILPCPKLGLRAVKIACPAVELYVLFKFTCFEYSVKEAVEYFVHTHIFRFCF